MTGLAISTEMCFKAISHSLTQVKGIENHCYRMGGDEFIIIVTGSSVDRLESIINDIQQIFVRPWFLKGEDYYCTISAGVAFSRQMQELWRMS